MLPSVDCLECSRGQGTVFYLEPFNCKGHARGVERRRAGQHGQVALVPVVVGGGGRGGQVALRKDPSCNLWTMRCKRTGGGGAGAGGACWAVKLPVGCPEMLLSVISQWQPLSTRKGLLERRQG